MYFYCFFSFEYFDPYDHYAVCWVTLISGSVHAGVSLTSRSSCRAFKVCSVIFVKKFVAALFIRGKPSLSRIFESVSETTEVDVQESRLEYFFDDKQNNQVTQCWSSKLSFKFNSANSDKTPRNVKALLHYALFHWLFRIFYSSSRFSSCF